MRSRLILAVVLLPVLSLAMASAQESQEAAKGLLGDESDGSRAHPTHLIPLFAEDEDGDKGAQVTPDADPLLPFSTKYTCGECHSYDVIRRGWHFNAMDETVPPGRPGEPWIYVDPKLGIQVPLSYRSWAGTIQPREFGLSEFAFTRLFGRHMPGGGPGEVKATDDADVGRQYISGKLEINCLACHNGHYGQDMGGVSGWAVQIAVRQNNRWAAAASCEFASVKGSAADMGVAYDPFMPEGGDKEPRVEYRDGAFDSDHQVLFDIVREVPNARCYYCHSDVYFRGTDEKTEKWSSEEDVHLKAGLTCVDCHRNDIHHEIIRGYPGEEEISDSRLAATTTCQGCHLPAGPNVPDAGRLGAPVPQHVGLPPVHFERLSCTACHSGPWPGEQAVFTKTSRAHRLGTPNVNKSEEMVPHILSPVFAHDGDKISPHKVIWPAYWGTRADDKVTPIALDVVEGPSKLNSTSWRSLERDLAGHFHGTDRCGPQVPFASGRCQCGLRGRWSVVFVERGRRGRGRSRSPCGEAVHVAPGAHRTPAAQSLGIRYCTDCHATDSPFFFGKVAVDSPIASDVPATRQMVGFQDISPFYAWAFSASFVFRPWFKVIALGASAVLGIVLLLYGLKALGAVARVLAEDE